MSARKYRNTPVVVDGIRFDSKGEAKRWQELKLLQRAGEIADLERQVRFPLRGASGTTVCHYTADFRYVEMDNGYAKRAVVEDFKGMKTPLFKLKAKLFRDNYGFDIRLTGAAA